MNIHVDLDGTICTNTDGNYTQAIPHIKTIKEINNLYNKGHTITYWTARGSTTNIDWGDLTKNQLKKWGAKYHSLIFGKPFYDLYIGDKCLNIKNINFKEML